MPAKHYAPKRYIHVGQIFAHWTVIAPGPNNKWSATQWQCQCDCGTVRVVSSRSLWTGNSKSCGCVKKSRDTLDRVNEILRQQRIRHGHRTHKTRTPTYESWLSMRQRVRNPNHPGFENYGGRGVRICARWDKFEHFLEDIGPRPSKNHSLDRLNTNGHYEPGNCRWATRSEQRRNRRPQQKSFLWPPSGSRGHRGQRPTG